MILQSGEIKILAKVPTVSFAGMGHFRQAEAWQLRIFIWSAGERQRLQKKSARVYLREAHDHCYCVVLFG